jgi:hypothetical protein
LAFGMSFDENPLNALLCPNMVFSFPGVLVNSCPLTARQQR